MKFYNSQLSTDVLQKFDLVVNGKLLIILLALILRLITLSSYETWADEKLSVLEANGMLTMSLDNGTPFYHADFNNSNNLNNVLMSVQKGDGGNGVLYVTTLHFWTLLLGNSDFSVRLLSVLLGVLVVILVYALCDLIFENKNIALIAMFFASIHPHLITYSQEGRTYSMAILFCLISTFLIFRIIKKANINYTDYILYSISFLCAFLSHYSTIYILISHIILLIIYKNSLNKDKVRLILFFSFSIFMILFFWYNLYGAEALKAVTERNVNYQKLSIQDPNNSFYGKISFKYFFGGILQNLLFFSGNTLQNFTFKILYLSPLLLIPFALIFYGIKMNIRTNLPVLSLVMLSISSILYACFLAVVSGHIISFQTCYSIFSTPFFIILFAYSIFNIKFNGILGTCLFLHLIIVLISTFSIYWGIDSNTKHLNEFESIAEIINNHHKNTDMLRIEYNNAEYAFELNKYLNKSVDETKQIIIPTNDCNILFYTSKASHCFNVNK